MICRFCGSKIDSGGDRFRCRICRAEYEGRLVQVRYPSHGEHMSYEVISEPPPEKETLCTVRARLLEIAKLVVPKPGEAILLLEDTWVELATVVRGDHYRLVDEVTRLREEVAALEAEKKKYLEALHAVAGAVAGT